MDDAFDDQIRELLASGNKLAAVKRYQEKTGVSLAEAKAAVESWATGSRFTDRVQHDDSEFTNQIVSLLRGGEKLKAVKLYRVRFGLDLRGSKEAVEGIGEQNGIPVSSRAGCFGVVLFGIATVAQLLN